MGERFPAAIGFDRIRVPKQPVVCDRFWAGSVSSETDRERLHPLADLEGALTRESA